MEGGDKPDGYGTPLIVDLSTAFHLKDATGSEPPSRASTLDSKDPLVRVLASEAVEARVKQKLSHTQTSQHTHRIKVPILGKRFTNPWPSAKREWVYDLKQWPFERHHKVLSEIRDVRVREVDFACPKDGGKLKATWLGHASVLVQLPKEGNWDGRTVNILFDPMFSKRASPFKHFGPKRRLSPPCKVDDLPPIHFVCISHNHYDHLDVPTIKALLDRTDGKKTSFFVPLGVGATLRKIGIENERIYELDWWEEVHLAFEAGSAGSLKIVCTPSQHGSSRVLLDWKKSLWCSWVVSATSGNLTDKMDDGDTKTSSNNTTTTTMFFGGDTGYRSSSIGPYNPIFEVLGDLYGPFDLAFIPIWRGACLACLSKLKIRLCPEAFTRALHATPTDAIHMHRDLRSKRSIAIHFGTFAGDSDEAVWPVQLLQRGCRNGSSGRKICFLRLKGDDGEPPLQSLPPSPFTPTSCLGQRQAQAVQSQSQLNDLRRSILHQRQSQDSHDSRDARATRREKYKSVFQVVDVGESVVV